MDSVPVDDEVLTESLLQFRILHADHYHSGRDRQPGQEPTYDEARPHAPGQHFAQVSQVNRMPHAGADSRGHQAVIAMPGANFWQAAELAG